jgi:hypothetical protein
VSAAGLSGEVPVQGGYGCVVQGFEESVVYDRLREAGLTTCAGQEPTTPGFFEAMGIPILEGRALAAGDNEGGAPAVVVVSRAFADRFWPGENAIGKGVAPSGRTNGPFYRVVGVAGDVAASAGEGQDPLSQRAVAVYYPIQKHPGAGWQNVDPAPLHSNRVCVVALAAACPVGSPVP